MAMKNPRTLASLNNFWLRTLLQLKPGQAPGPVEESLRATFHVLQEERVQGFPSLTKRDRERMLQERLSLEPAAAGRSNLQRDYRLALLVLGLLVALVLMIACAKVANLMTAQAAARAREMALRVSLGAGRGRLMQLVLVESALLALVATAIGWVFAWWSAPLVVGMINPPAYAARLILPVDWRLAGFALALTCCVTFFFGLAPAMRVSAVKPVSALRGGQDRHSRGRSMRTLVAAQVAFCFIVHLAAGVFVATFNHLTNQPTGFSAERVLNLESVSTRPQSPVLWEQVADRLRTGAPANEVYSDFVTISPGWADLMRIPLLGGRDFRAGDANPAVAIVNQAFAKQYFNNEDPVGRYFDRVEPAGGRSHFQVVGLIRDARSRDRLRSPIRPTAYIPFPAMTTAGTLQPAARGTFVVRTASANPLALASALRKEVSLAGLGFRVRAARNQVELNQTDTAKERLLAVLATFFAGVALLLAGVGLYGVLDYSVLQRRREIGIRLAIGAQSHQVVRGLTADIFATVLAGAVIGLCLAMLAMKSVESMLFRVRPTDLGMLALPSATILAVTLLAAVPAVIHALRIDPVAMLRGD